MIETLWYSRHPLRWALAPIALLYQLFMSLRGFAYQAGLLPVKRASVPVIVVGNLAVGGTGKTPLVIWLVNYLKQNHYRPGVVSRGYGGAAQHWPQQVRPDSDPVMTGDEPVVIARNTGCPVAASPDRYTAVEQLIEHQHCNIIICDDGLQHLALARDIEIAVIDGQRRFGNGFCLPAGPLRESIGRLNSVDLIVCNGLPQHGEYAMEIVPREFHAVAKPQHEAGLETFRNMTVHAVAGTGNPDRFFALLRSLGIRIIEHPFPDHYRFRREDLRFDDGLPVIMTEKDAVKCMAFAADDHWYLAIDVKMAGVFEHRFSKLLKDITHGQKTA